MFVSSLSTLTAMLVNRKVIIYHNYIGNTKISKTYKPDSECDSSVIEECTVISLTNKISHFERGEYNWHYMMLVKDNSNQLVKYYFYYDTELEII